MARVRALLLPTATISIVDTAVDIYQSSEMLMLEVNCRNPVCCISIYHPLKPNNHLLKWLSSSVHIHNIIIIGGDFNIHIDQLSNNYARELLNISFGKLNHESRIIKSRATCGHLVGLITNALHFNLIFTWGLSINSLSLLHLVSDNKCALFYFWNTTVFQPKHVSAIAL